MRSRTIPFSLLMALGSLLACSQVTVPDAEGSVASELAGDDEQSEGNEAAAPAAAQEAVEEPGAEGDVPLAGVAPMPPPAPPPMGLPPPPPEAFAACEGSSDGVSCNVTIAKHTIDGTCRQGPSKDAPLVCVPAHLPPPPMAPPGGPRQP